MMTRNKRHFLALIVLVGLISMALSNPILGQQSEVAEWIDENTAMVIHFSDVGRTCEYVHGLSVFSNPIFQKGVKLLKDDRFPVVHSERLQAIEKLGAKLLDLTSEISEAAIVVHEITLQSAKLTILVKAETRTLDDLQSIVTDIAAHLRVADRPIATETDRDLDELPENEIEIDRDELFGAIGEFSQARVGSWCIVSNEPSVAEGLRSRLSGDSQSKFKSLADSRKYQTAVARLARLADSKGLITVYGNPNRLAALFPFYDEKTWSAMQVTEMPAFGGHVRIVEPQRDTANDEPQVLIDGVLLFTLPASGIAKVFEAYRPIQSLPPFAFPIGELEAIGRDERETYDAKRQIHDSVYGEGAYDQTFQKAYRDSPENHYQETLSRRSEKFSLRHGKPDVLYRSMLVIERLGEPIAMRTYVTDLISRLNKRKPTGEKIEEINAGDATIWHQTEEAALRHFKREFEPDSEELKVAMELVKAVPLTLDHDGYAIVGDWYLLGQWHDVKQQLQAIREDHSEHRDRLNHMIDDLQKWTGYGKKPCQIQLIQNVKWLRTINKLESAFIEKNYTPEQQAVMAYSEDGYRIKPNSRKELAALAVLRFGEAIAESYGRQLILVSKDNGAIRMSVGVYPNNPE